MKTLLPPYCLTAYQDTAPESQLSLNGTDSSLFMMLSLLKVTTLTDEPRIKNNVAFYPGLGQMNSSEMANEN